ncbi:MAG: histidine kinase [Bacteroidales bacterium]|nr:histidine kinase [Bacteroidales bacterium]
MKRIPKVLLSPYSIALIIAVAIILLLPPIFNKYKVSLIKSETFDYPDGFVQYVDLNNDGYSEKIISYYAESTNHPAIQIFMHDGGLYDQWNLQGKYVPGWDERIMYGDCNNDSIKELYIFTQTKDSILLHCISEFDGTFNFRNKYITSISLEYSDKIDYSIHPENVIDLNTDNYPDLLFSVQAGFSLQPKILFIYDVHNDSLIQSVSFGNLISNISCIDLDGDGKPEIIGDCFAAGNVTKGQGIYLHDYSAWLMVFNNKLELLFEPIEFPGFKTELYVRPIKIGDKNFIAAYKHHLGSEDNDPVLFYFDKDGNIVKEKKIPRSPKTITDLFIPDRKVNINSSFYLIKETGEIIEYGADMGQIKTYWPVNEIIHPRPGIFDFNQDNKPEYVFPNRASSSYYITTENFSHVCKINILQIGGTHISLKLNGKKAAELVTQMGNHIEFYTYNKNTLYYIRFLIYFGIYLGLLSFITLIRKLQQIQMREKFELRNEISQLQLQTIRNQMDPHFTFNVFSSIASMIKKEKKDVAYDSFLKFSNMVRSTLEASDKITRTIEEEMIFVESYLDLEKLRYKDKFIFEIVIDNDVDMKWRIPKMVLQTYVENAIKHGLRHKEEKGLLTIHIKKDNKNLVIKIEDNGIGRKKAAEVSSDSTGKGLSIMEHYFTLFNQYNDTKIGHEIIDLTDAGVAIGTRIVVTIPRGFRYKLGVGGSQLAVSS